MDLFSFTFQYIFSGVFKGWRVIAPSVPLDPQLRWSIASDSFSRFLALYQFVCMYVCPNPIPLSPNPNKGADIPRLRTNVRSRIYTCSPVLFLAPHYGAVCLWISEICRLLTHLSGIINCFLLAMLHISGTVIYVIVCNCMSFRD